MPTRPADDVLSVDFLVGTDGEDIDANDIPIDDAGNYFTSPHVEGALQEIGAGIGPTGGHYEVLMADGVTFPPDPLTTDDGTDWLYGWVSP